MGAAQNVCHPGIIQSVEPQLIRVNILSMSACGNCHAKGSCALVETQDKIIDIHNPENSGSFSIGEQVEIVMQESLGLKALFLGYITPFLFVFFTLIVLISVTGNEKLAGLVSIATLIPYYSSLYYFRHSLKKSFSFSIRKIHN